MGYKVIGTLKHDDEVYEHGDTVSESKVGGKDNFKALVASGALVTDEEFDRLYPSDEEGEVIDASGTPSNLREVEGTKLQADMPEGSDDPETENPPGGKAAPANPANPPEVKGAHAKSKAE